MSTFALLQAVLSLENILASCREELRLLGPFEVSDEGFDEWCSSSCLAIIAFFFAIHDPLLAPPTAGTSRRSASLVIVAGFD